jgi:hypothetical protein
MRGPWARAKAAPLQSPNAQRRHASRRPSQLAPGQESSADVSSN